MEELKKYNVMINDIWKFFKKYAATDNFDDLYDDCAMLEDKYKDSEQSEFYFEVVRAHIHEIERLYYKRKGNK